MQAAVLRARLSWLPRWTEQRRVLARLYRERLGTALLQVPPECDAGHVYHLFPVMSAERAALQEHLRLRGVETLIHYAVPIPRQRAMADQQPADCPVANRVCAQVFSLPLYPALAPAAVDGVAAALQAFHAPV